MSGTILRSEAWKLIDSGEPFNLGFVTADRRRGTGGDYKEVSGYRKVKKDPLPEVKVGKPQLLSSSLNKNPNHGLHKTVNIYDPRDPKKHITKIHYRLFDRFNGKTVLQ
jgi:hypothetical protein